MAPSDATINALGAVGGILLGACQLPQLIKLYRCAGRVLGGWVGRGRRQRRWSGGGAVPDPPPPRAVACRTKSARDLSFLYLYVYSGGLLFIVLYLWYEQALVGFVCECVELGE